MKRKITLLALVLVLAILATSILFACNDGVNGKYYKYEDGVKNENSWIELNGKKWTDDAGDKGKLEEKDGSLEFYDENGEWICSGKVSNGVLVLESLFGSSEYRKDGATGNVGDGSQVGNSEVDEKAKVVGIQGGSVDGLTVLLEVAPEVMDVDLSGMLTVSKNSSWQLYADKMGQTLIPTKYATNLHNGDNFYYIVVNSEDGSVNRTYTLAIFKNYYTNIYLKANNVTVKTIESVLTHTTVELNPPSEMEGYYLAWSTNSYYVTENNKVIEASGVTPKTYTVTLDAERGSLSGESRHTLTYGTEYTLPIPTREGYTFMGWKCNGNMVTNPDGSSISNFRFTQNLTYYDTWSVNYYNLTVISSDTSRGTVNEVSGEKAFGTNVTLKATPKEGYSFEGWYKDSVYGTKVSDNSTFTITMDDDSATYVAKFICYTITTNTNLVGAGTFTNYSSKKVSAGEMVTLTATTNAGYTWLGWYDGATKVSEGTSLTYTFAMGTESKIFTAKWTYYTLSTNTNLVEGGTYTSYDNEKITAGERVTLSATTNVGYAWLGWYDGEIKVSEGTSLTYTFTMGEENKTYTAKWTYHTLSTTTNLVGAGTYTRYDNKKTSVGERITLTATTNAGYTWLGWYDGATKVSEGTSLTYTFTMGTESKTYTAKWYKINLSRNDTSAGTISTLNGKYVVGDEATITATTNAGYTWLGWYDGETKVSEGTSLTYTFTMGTESKTYTAKWTYYTLSTTTNLVGAGTYTKYDSKKITVGENITLTASTNVGYVWLGWYDGNTKVSEGTSLTYTFTMGTESKTYTAKWMYHTISTTTNLKGAGTYTKYDSKKTSVGENITLTATTNVGYDWLGWYDGETKVSEGTSLTYTFTMGTESKTYTAKWEVSEEMSNFNFTSTTTTCTITGIKDETVKELVVPNSVTSIGDDAFRDCDSLTSLTIPNSVTSIGYQAFDDCTSLSSVNYLGTIEQWCGITFGSLYANPLSNGAKLYLNGELVEDLVIPNTITEITYAFYGCTSLTSVTIGNSVTSIGDYAFRYCTSLSSVTIGNSVTSIGYHAFYSCDSLSSVTIGNSVISVESWAFDDCTSLSSVNYLGTIEQWCGITFNAHSSNPLYNGAKLYLNGELVEDLVIPNTVTEIKDYAFRGCTSIKSVTIPDSVTSIGSYAFEYCDSISSVTIGNSVTSIGVDAFRYCTSLTSVTIGNSVTSMGSSAFWGCDSLTSVNYLGTIDQWCGITFGFGANPLSYGAKLYLNGELVEEDLVIPNTITEIKAYAFEGCTSIKSVTIPDSVTSIGDYAFSSCSSLSSVNYLGTIEQWCGITFGYYANPLCNGAKLYLNGELVEDLVIPNTVTEIKAFAFYHCDSITSVTIPDSVTSIGSYAFERCTSLSSVNYLGTIEQWCGITFGGASANPLYFAKKLYLNGELVEDLVIPNTVTEIKDYAFYDCDSLSSVTIGNSVTSIGMQAFYDCDSLSRVTIPNSVTSIGEYAFYNCDSLTYNVKDNVKYLGNEGNLYLLAMGMVDETATSLTIDDNCRFVHGWAFYRGHFSSVTIPDSVTSIGEDAFYSRTSLSSVNYLGTIEQWCGITFGGSSANPLCYGAKLYLNGELVEDLVIPNTVTEIKDYAFRGCASIKSVTIPSSVTSIGNSAFSSCDALSTVYYNGTKEEWSGISGNSNLTSATRYYYSETEPVGSGNYWHYVDGVPTPW